MSRQPRSRIENFGQRLDWLIHHAEPDLEQLGFIASREDLHRRVDQVIGQKALAVSARTWARYMKLGTADDRTLEAIRRVYPSAVSSKRNLMTCSWSDFERHTTVESKANERWTAATRFFGKNRPEVERLGKIIYGGINELGSFPLIGLREWLVDKPIRIAGPAGRALKRLQYIPAHDRSHKNELSLPGLNVPYHLLKMAALNRIRKPPFNGDCYVIKSLKSSNNYVSLQFGLGDYYSYINTCEAHAALIADLRLNYGENPSETDINEAFKQADWTIDNALNWNSRNSFLGVNCLMIIKSRHEGDRFFLHRRSSKAVEAQGVWHVVPAGGHQPLNLSFSSNSELDIAHTATREMLEEIFGCEELAYHGVKTTNFFDQNLRTFALHSALVRSRAMNIFYLGIGLDPATLKPESLCTIVIDWDKAADIYYNARSTPLRDEIGPNWEGQVKSFPLHKSALLNLMAGPRPGDAMLPAGSACLILAARHFERLMA